MHLTKRKRGVVFGDLNLNLLSKEKSIREYRRVVKVNGFKIINKIDKSYCTRETPTSKTILDHICTNLLQNTFHMSVIESCLSDHKQIYLEIKQIKTEKPSRVQYEAVNYIGYYNSVQNLIIANNHFDSKYYELESILMQALAKNKVAKTKILNPPRKDWINKTLINSINERNTIWHDLKQNPEDCELKERFRKIRNLTHINIQSAKNLYYQTAFKNCKSKPLKMWQLINSLAHNTAKTNTIPIIYSRRPNYKYYGNM
ncbi:unnamed protein product [Euphydryas editha]|nr:unnamed protein product [Euphydryas editha]